MAKVKSEYEVETLFIDRLQELGYSYIELKNYSDVIDNFRAKLCEFNAEKLIEAKGVAELSDTEFDRVMLRLDNHTIYESAKILREQWVLDLDNGKKVYLEFISDIYNRNIFQVTHQVTMDKEHKDDVLYKNRYDVTILINGLPLLQIELKRPGVEINEAINQINRYRRFSFRGLFRFIQIFVVSNSTQTKYFSNVNERSIDGQLQSILKSLAFYWTTEDNKRINKLIEFTNDFLTIQNVTEVLTKYFVIKENEPILMVMRPYQIYAVKKAFNRIMMANMNGYIFHTTGSGKTLTSYKLATLLRDDKRIKKVFFLIDRKDLDDQTVDEYNTFEPGCVDNTDDTRMLIASLKDSSKNLIVTTIQKMASALRNERYTEIMNRYKKEKVVFIIDECHRSQFGKMHGSIKRHFENANYIGFTGTPIFAENKTPDGRTTADVFYSGKLEPCIHKYMIKEAIADGNVLKFSVEYMKSINASSTNSKFDLKQIDDPEYCKKNKIDIEELYHDENRIQSVSNDILEHLEQHIHPTGKDIYTAIFAVDYIPTLMEYYRYLKSHNPKNYKIAAIFTFQPNEDLDDGATKYSGEELKECMNDYNKMFGTSYDLSTFDAYRKDIAKRMKQKEAPQIDLLLVVNMFLTGFDSKATNTLILDKNLVWHTLVQAYSRTNRVDKLTKQFGQIITYRNIKEAQDNALRLYSGDGNPNDYLLEGYDTYCLKYGSYAESVKSIAPTSDFAGEMQSEEDKRLFVLAFRKLASTLNTLKTFSKFDWKDIEIYMDEEEFYDYKSWFLSFYDEIKREAEKEQYSVLTDVDFEIELIRTDKINVVYILNLLKDINRSDKSEMDKSIDLVMREIERSDNEKLRYKRDIMKKFITDKFFELSPEDDILVAYNEYEKNEMINDIETFAQEKNIDIKIVSEIVTQYFIDPKQVTKENVRTRLADQNLGLLGLTKLINELLVFVKDMNNKYTVEGD